MAKKLKVKLVRGLAGKKNIEIKIAGSLGLRKTNQERVHPDNPIIRGQIRKIKHLLEITEE